MLYAGSWLELCSNKTLHSRARPTPCFTPPQAALTIYFLASVSITDAYRSTGFGEEQRTLQTPRPPCVRQEIESAVEISGFFPLVYRTTQTKKMLSEHGQHTAELSYVHLLLQLAS